MTNTSRKCTPVQRFDVTYGEPFRLYDNMTYYRDKKLCDTDAIKKNSGNLVKYYRCDTSEPISLGGDN